MSEAKQPTFQHGFGFQKGEGLFALPHGEVFDTRKPNPKKGISGSNEKTWRAFGAKYPNIVRQQNQNYSKLKLVQLQRLVKKLGVQLKKGESIDKLKVEELVAILQEWEKFKR